MLWKAVVGGLCAAFAFSLPTTKVLAQEDCTAIPTIVGSETTSVTVTCGPGEESAGFATSYGDGEYDGDGDDVVIISGGQVFANSESGQPVVDGTSDTLHEPDLYLIELRDGNNRFEIRSGQIGVPADTGVTIVLGNGDDTFVASGGTIYGGISPEPETFPSPDGSDAFLISGTAYIRDKIWAGTDNNTLMMTGGYLGEIQFEDGNDNVDISGGQLGELIFLGGTNQVTLSGTGQIGPTEGEQPAVEFLGGTNTFTMTGGLVAGWVSGGGGTENFRISGGTVAGEIDGEGGDDVIDISGGTLAGDIAGGFGFDEVAISGGHVQGDIDADSVLLYGGRLDGDITGLQSLVIDDQQSTAPLVLRDGVLFSGTLAEGSIVDTDLAKVQNGSFLSQNFSGFSSLSVSNSTLGFTSSQVLDEIDLSDGSTLYVTGNVTLEENVVPEEEEPDFSLFASDVSVLSHTSPFADVYLTSSSINMINGSPNDVLQVGDLTLQNALLGIDVDQGAALGDQILVGGVFTVNGLNTIQVNLVGTPFFGATTQIPILAGGAPAGGGSFAITGVPDTLSSLFNYEIVPGAAGGLFLLATPGDLSPLGAVKAAIDAQPVMTALDAIDSVMDDAVEWSYELPGSLRAAQVSPTFGIFASGQWARVSHDGFEVSSGGISGAGPSFTADDFSATISLDWNAAKHFGFEDRYGLNIGFFGGYTSTDVSLDPFMSFTSLGSAENESGMFGLYGLFRKGFTYTLVSATTFIGETDIVNDLLGSAGSYDTTGFAMTASLGRIYPLSDRVRFDLRGGIVGVTFTGDGFTDSAGYDFGKSRVSFGALKFEPGIYSEHRLENGWILSPYARGEMQVRFGYRNTGSFEGSEFDFDDSDVSLSLSAGLNLKTSPKSTMSAEFRGKASSDSTTIAGKIGYKVAF
ncbi:autotransporter outer membrane beta-barrel domain-containing protein [Chelativorans sp. AA-79]|uniref:autotransporter outer membrane beta-barrel domain-containing protein n=1 Tax=Chelativorans sp. AA-79 TaxID=3028735 RepID=UPI0023F6F183|nr:autotransporter outer membrane beta-barrel domain-containing protein [Chelativorans sp. AA-79]WEX10849.1 autotransporter outer membrane beta-barrel domain-containing protein [Chelativorans sp. AA-79]